MPMPVDEVAAALVERSPGSVFVESHGQPVVYVDRAVFADVAHVPARRAAVHDVADVTAVDHLLDGARVTPDRASRSSASRSSRTTCRTRATGASV